jgi:hypothetical protein
MMICMIFGVMNPCLKASCLNSDGEMGKHLDITNTHKIIIRLAIFTTLKILSLHQM